MFVQESVMTMTDEVILKRVESNFYSLTSTYELGCNTFPLSLYDIQPIQFILFLFHGCSHDYDQLWTF